MLRVSPANPHRREKTEKRMQMQIVVEANPRLMWGRENDSGGFSASGAPGGQFPLAGKNC